MRLVPKDEIQSLEQVFDEASNFLEDVGGAAKLFAKVYRAQKEVRFRLFINGCLKTIKAKGDLPPEEKVDLKKWFDGDFAFEHLQQFTDAALRQGSKIATYAIAKLYIESHEKKATNIRTLQALEQLSDEDAKLLLAVYKIKRDSNDEFAANVRRSDVKFDFLFSQTDYDANIDSFAVFGIKHPYELRSRLEHISSNGVFVTNSGLATNGGEILDIDLTREGADLLLLLDWSQEVLGQEA